MNMRYFPCLILLVLGFGCGRGDGSEGTPSLRLEGEAVKMDDEGADYRIDFGRVPIGGRSEPELFFVNDGPSPLTIRVEKTELDASFSLPETRIEIPARSRRSLGLSFSPQQEGAFEGRIGLRLSQLGQVRQVRLLGAGGKIECGPTELDLGTVVIGESRTKTVTCENPHQAPASVTIGRFLHASPSHFSAVFGNGIPGDTATIPPGGSLEIEVRYAAVDTPGPATAVLPLYGVSGHELVRIDIDARAIPHAIQVFREDESGEKIPLSTCLPFPTLGIGEGTTRSLYLRNLGQSSVEITEASLGATDHFALLSPLDESVVLAPEEELELELAYEPRTSESHRAELRIQAAEERAVPPQGLEICLSGSSEGATLRCEEEALDFGPVAVGTSVTHTLRCSNASVTPPDGTPQQLQLLGVVTSDSQFTATVRSADGSSGIDGYAPGETFFLDLTFSPSDVGPRAGEVVLLSSAIVSKLSIDVQGEGRDLPPCDFILEPSTLDFGVVSPGEALTLTAYVVNGSTEHECILSNLRLGEETDPAFSLEPVHTVILPPRSQGTPTSDHRHPIRVRFAPTEEGPHTGSAAFFVSHPLNGAQAVGLSGVGGASCVHVDLEFAEFQENEPSCASRPARISVGNFCADDIIVEAGSIDAAYGTFGLAPLGVLPAQLEEGERFEFEATFLADALGAFDGAVRIEVRRADDGSPLGPFLVPLRGEAVRDPFPKDRFEVGKKLDLLLVMDNSGAVPVDQLQARVDLLLDPAFKRGFDVQVGVTTTGVVGPACAPTGFEEAEEGRLVPHPSLGLPRILRTEMGKDAMREALERNLDVGHCHSDEAVYEAAWRAISSPAIHTPLEEAGNQGFLRNDAALAILALTDEWDAGSPEPVPAYVDFFRDRKPSWREEEVKVHMISGGLSDCSLGLDSASACPRCVEGTVLTGGFHLELCQEPAGWDQGIGDLADEIFAQRARFPLRGLPADANSDGVVDEADMELWIDEKARPDRTPNGARVWRYDPSTNVVEFEALYVPDAGAVVEIAYLPTCAAP